MELCFEDLMFCGPFQTFHQSCKISFWVPHCCKTDGNAPVQATCASQGEILSQCISKQINTFWNIFMLCKTWPENQLRSEIKDALTSQSLTRLSRLWGLWLQASLSLLQETPISSKAKCPLIYWYHHVHVVLSCCIEIMTHTNGMHWLYSIRRINTDRTYESISSLSQRALRFRSPLKLPSNSRAPVEGLAAAGASETCFKRVLWTHGLYSEDLKHSPPSCIPIIQALKPHYQGPWSKSEPNISN